MAKRPPTKTKRLFKLAGMTASVAGGYAKSKVKSWVGLSEDDETRAQRHAWSGEKIAETLGELKGAAMKVGQMAAAGWDLLPKEMADALRSLQKDAPPAPFSQIQECIEQEFGRPTHELFAQLDETPYGAASIGQVHRARLFDGRDVIVKVQYPGVDAAVDSDLAQLKLLAKAKGLIVDKKALDDTFEEIRERMVEELDYEFEAQQCRTFGAMFASFSRVIVPSVVDEYSTKKVITTTFEPSDPLDQLEKLAYPQATRDAIGTQLYTLLWEQIFRHGRLHADPHPGNFGARRNGSLVIYDFGCVKQIQADFLPHYRALLIAAFRADYPALEQALRGLQVRRLEGPEIDPQYYQAWRALVIEPFLEHLQYDFGQSQLHRNLLDKVPEAIRHMSSFKPARELVFLDRTMLGHYGNLRAIAAKVRCAEILSEYVPEIRDSVQSALDRAHSK